VASILRRFEFWHFLKWLSSSCYPKGSFCGNLMDFCHFGSKCSTDSSLLLLKIDANCYLELLRRSPPRVISTDSPAIFHLILFWDSALILESEIFQLGLKNIQSIVGVRVLRDLNARLLPSIKTKIAPGLPITRLKYFDGISWNHIAYFSCRVHDFIFLAYPQLDVSRYWCFSLLGWIFRCCYILPQGSD